GAGMKGKAGRTAVMGIQIGQEDWHTKLRREPGPRAASARAQVDNAARSRCGDCPAQQRRRRIVRAGEIGAERQEGGQGVAQRRRAARKVVDFYETQSHHGKVRFRARLWTISSSLGCSPTARQATTTSS